MQFRCLLLLLCNYRRSMFRKYPMIDVWCVCVRACVVSCNCTVFYREVNTVNLFFFNKSASPLQCNNRCLLCEPYKTHSCTLRGERRISEVLSLVVRKVNSRLRRLQWPGISAGRVSLSVIYVLVVMEVIAPCCLHLIRTILSCVGLLCASKATTCKEISHCRVLCFAVTVLC